MCMHNWLQFSIAIFLLTKGTWPQIKALERWNLDAVWTGHDKNILDQSKACHRACAKNVVKWLHSILQSSLAPDHRKPLLGIVLMWYVWLYCKCQLLGLQWRNAPEFHKLKLWPFLLPKLHVFCSFFPCLISLCTCTQPDLFGDRDQHLLAESIRSFWTALWDMKWQSFRLAI